MADPKSQQEMQPVGTIEANEFDSLLKKEFKPKTDEAKEAVERAVRTLAEQALSQTTLISGDVTKSIEAIIAQIDTKLSEQINQILHTRRFPEARRRLARPALSRQQHRDRRDAEDPRDEHHASTISARP